MLKTWLFLSILGLGFAPQVDGSVPEPPDRAMEEAVAPLLALTSVQYFSTDRALAPQERRDRVAAASRQFDEGLTALSRSMQPSRAGELRDQEGDSIEGKLAWIAVDRARRGAVYKEIATTYVMHRMRPWRSQSAPPLQARHTVERYRLPFELSVLAPAPAEPSPGYVERAMDALATIGNPASAVTLAQAYRATTNAGIPVDAPVIQQQEMILEALIRIPSPASLHAILESLEASDRQRAGEALGTEGWEPRRVVRERLAELRGEPARAWLDVIERFQLRDLAEDRARFLEELEVTP